MNECKANPSRVSRPAEPSKAKPEAASAVATKEAPSPPLPSEAKAIADAVERAAARRARIVASVKSENGVVQIASPHSDDVGFVLRLRNCLGTNSEAFTNQALGRLGAVLRRKGAALQRSMA